MMSPSVFHRNRRVIHPSKASISSNSSNAQRFREIASQTFHKTYRAMIGNYVAIATLLMVILLTLLLPDISQKLQAQHELKAMKKVLDMVSNEVNRAEVACLTVADDICRLQCSMHDGTTETSTDLQDLSVCTSVCLRPTQSAPVQVEKKIGFFKRIFFNRNASHKEIALMSYVYTDSFDDDKKIHNED